MVHAGPLQKLQVHSNIHRGRLRSCDFMQNYGLSIQCIFLVELSKFKFSFILNAFLNAFINSEYINSNSNSRTIYGFLYRVFPEVWISFSDKVSKANPSTRLTFKYRKKQLNGRGILMKRTWHQPENHKTYQQRVQLNCSNTISVLSVLF